MRLPAATAILALAVAGAAIAQAHNNPVYGMSPPQPSSGSYGSVQAAPDLLPNLTVKQQAAISSAVHRYQIACRTDLDSLCNAKWRHRADECLAYHRLRLTSSCKQAMDRLIVAKRG